MKTQIFQVKCSCGKNNTQDNSTFIGVQNTSERIKFVLHLYNCTCGSTFGVKVNK